MLSDDELDSVGGEVPTALLTCPSFGTEWGPRRFSIINPV
jgi:hypothetical protein